MTPKNCPVCGASASLVGGSYVTCNGDCTLCGPTMPSASEAIDAWNRLECQEEEVHECEKPCPSSVAFGSKWKCGTC